MNFGKRSIKKTHRFTGGLGWTLSLALSSRFRIASFAYARLP
jgi:hypothetical protein